MPADTAPLVIAGTLIHAPRRGTLDIRERAVINVAADGRIRHVASGPQAEQERNAARIAGTLLDLAPGQVLLPGMVDLHVHAPQWPQAGKALHLPLEQWLQQCTFPLEARYADLEFASRVYESLVGALLAHGTTTAMYFATVHVEASVLLARTCLSRGQRALVGRVAMDNAEQCPAYYRDGSTAQGLDDTRRFIEQVRSLPQNGAGHVLPVVTPRFIPGCSDALLQGLGELAHAAGCHVQTHCSESDWAHDYVRARHGMTDTASLDRFGLVTRRTVLAHANLVEDRDIDVIAARGSGIAHCPLSNFYFSNAVFPARRALDAGLHVGLGTDISGGPSPSLLRNCAHAVTASRALEEGVDPRRRAPQRGSPGARINFMEAFWMATTGGGEALDLKIGCFEPGYEFDAIVVDSAAPPAGPGIWPELDTPEDVLQKILYHAGPEQIRSVWVGGRKVAGH